MGFLYQCLYVSLLTAIYYITIISLYHYKYHLLTPCERSSSQSCQSSCLSIYVYISSSKNDNYFLFHVTAGIQNTDGHGALVFHTSLKNGGKTPERHFAWHSTSQTIKENYRVDKLAFAYNVSYSGPGRLFNAAPNACHLAWLGVGGSHIYTRYIVTRSGVSYAEAF